MKRLVVLFGAFIMSLPAVAVTPVEGRGRASMAGQMESRFAVSKKAIDNMPAAQAVDVETESKQVETVPAVDAVQEKPKDMREREKAACIQNNIGVGATFVWA